MKSLLTVIVLALVVSASADDWVYPGTKGDGGTREVTVPGGWTLSCTAVKSGGKLNVNKIVGFPEEPAVLDVDRVQGRRRNRPRVSSPRRS